MKEPMNKAKRGEKMEYINLIGLKLKKCPFCGGKNISIKSEYIGTENTPDWNELFIKCEDCGASSGSGGKHDSNDPHAQQVKSYNEAVLQSVKLWNSRAPKRKPNNTLTTKG